ncbi:hypothetical protein DITRI_Ditri15bG0127100 [Diplodiscus trichospermus]
MAGLGGRSRARNLSPHNHRATEEHVTNYPGTSQHQNHGGWSISQRPQVSAAKEPAVSSSEAARFYGGTMIFDYSKNKPLRRPYY